MTLDFVEASSLESLAYICINYTVYSPIPRDTGAGARTPVVVRFAQAAYTVLCTPGRQVIIMRYI